MNNPELDLAFDFVQYTNRNVFLTGKAGTGKTTFLHNLRKVTPKRMVIVAPTGVAAINAGGVTIHSFFQLPFGPILPGRLDARDRTPNKNNSFQRFNKRKINIIRTLDLLVIDEISMVRADMLDGIDHVLRQFKNKTKPFGGVQLLMIGDLQQLAPVVKEEERILLQEHFDTFYFFSSKAFKESGAVSIELKYIYRQQDINFIKILNEIRDDRLTNESINILNKQYKPGFNPESEEGYITLTTHNAIANRLNEEKLRKLKTDPKTFKAEVYGSFPEYSYPAEEFLTLKTGAQVMFIKNDSLPEKRYYNGKIGKVKEIDDETLNVQCKDEDYSIEISRERWENVTYTINDRSKEIEEEVTGTFIQYPLRLAWAITIHKSQGLTFEKAVIDAKEAFAHGQTYVAFSRCKSLEGLVLSTPISSEGIICDPTVGIFNAAVEKNQPDSQILNNARQQYMMELLDELFSFRQMQYHIDKCKKLIVENSRIILGNAEENLNEMLVNGTTVLIAVYEKFIGQLKYLTGPSGSENQLQERIIKGAGYFYEQSVLHLKKPLQQISFETDNKTISKSLDEVFTKIHELLGVKLQCLDHCKNGFEMKSYLSVRAKAALEPVSELKTEKPKISIGTSKHPVLFERIRAWRKTKASEENLPIYRIISQQAVMGISNFLPGNSHQLLHVKGFGQKKLDQYGDEILKIVREYCDESNLDVTLAMQENKKQKINTRELSLSLFNEGKTVSQIAELRQMTEGTIEGHLAYFVGTGELEVHQFVSKEKLAIIANFFKTFPDALLSEAKEALDSSITYSDLKFARKHIESLTDIDLPVNPIPKYV
ncbi:MAG: helix-turn-helix domain-containing protein [Bacteroidales bacterium]|nr:helix-turn-helix domain-containing protein [Bacteroidales bacterium]